MSYARNLARLSRSGAPTVDTAQDLRDLTVFGGLYPARVVTVGASTKEDGGGGEWAWYESSTDADNLGTVLAPTGGGVGRWHRIREPNDVDASWWGLVADGATDNYAQIQAAIDYAENLLLGNIAGPSNGISVFLPSSALYISDTLLIQEEGLSLIGASGRGTALVGDAMLVNVYSDPANASRTQNVQLVNLVFIAKDQGTTATGVTVSGAHTVAITNCQFWNWNICLAMFWTMATISNCIFKTQGRDDRSQAWIDLQGLDNTLTTPGAVNPCHGVHIADCEFAGSNAAGMETLYGILVQGCDGLYIDNSHMQFYVTGLSLNNQATPENHTITSVHVSNTYFDAPVRSAAGVSSRPIDVVGTVAEAITMADGSTQVSSFGGFIFGNTYLRSAGISDNCFSFDVSETGDWNTDRDPWQIQFSGCAFERSKKAALNIVSPTNVVYPESLIVDGCAFRRYNEDEQVDIGGAINGKFDSAVITNNTFNSWGYTSEFTVLIGSPTSSCVVSGNDLTLALATSEQIRVSLGIDVIGLIDTDNNLPGNGQVIRQQYRVSTNGATPLLAVNRAIGDAVVGFAEVVVSGRREDGAKTFNGRYSVAYRVLNTGVLGFSNGTDLFDTDSEWNPGGVVAPVVGKTPGLSALQATVTGGAGEVWLWTIDMDLKEV